MAVVLEVGPATVRRVGGESGDRTAVAAALRGVDDPFVLVGERPVEVAVLWRALLTPLLRPGPGVVIVHPSWWPQRRLDVVLDAVKSVDTPPGGPRARKVVAVARRDLIAADGAEVVVEIGPELVAVSNGVDLATFERTDGAGIARVVAGWSDRDARAVRIDAPDELPGAAGTARSISTELWAHGITARRVDLAAVAPSAAAEISAHRPGPVLGRLRGRVALCGLAGMVTAGIVGVAVIRPHPAAPVSPPSSAERGASLVEGRVAVDVPAGWPVRRVTGGPGSRRVVVTSPTDPGAALHITQTYAPGSDLARAADLLSRAAGTQPPGVFVDFRANDAAGGRPAITYREVRPGTVVRWSVVLVGATQISIGCQSADGREGSIRAACDDAVRSAREAG